METLLTLTEVAELEFTNYFNIYRKIQRNKIEAIKTPVDSRKGFEYRISLDQLTKKAQQRYYAQ